MKVLRCETLAGMLASGGLLYQTRSDAIKVQSEIVANLPKIAEKFFPRAKRDRHATVTRLGPKILKS